MMGRLLLILCVMLLSSNAGGQSEDLEIAREKVAIQSDGWILHHPDKRRCLQSVKKPKGTDGIHILATEPKQNSILVAGRRYDPKDSLADYLTIFKVSHPDTHHTAPSISVKADTSYLGDPVFSMQTTIKTTATLVIPDSAAMRFVIKESYRDSVIADKMVGFDERSADGSFVYTLSIIMDFPVNFEVTAQAYVFTVKIWTDWPDQPIWVRYDSRRSQGGIGQTQPPSDFALAPIYPNPLSIGNGLQVAHISFQLPEEARVRIAVYNLLGQEIIHLLEDNAIMPAGRYTVTWQAQNQFGNPLPAGIYLIRMVSNKFVDQRKLVVIR
jgi:hypothetical protein